MAGSSADDLAPVVLEAAVSHGHARGRQRLLCSWAEGAVPSCAAVRTARDAVDGQVLHHGQFKNTNASRPYRFSSGIMLLVLMVGRT